MGGYFLCGPRISTSLLAGKKTPGCSAALIFMGQRISHPMEVGRRLVVAPAHQHIADIAGDHLLPRLNAGPLLAFAVFTGTNLQAASPGRWNSSVRQSNRCARRPATSLLRLLGCIVMQHAQGALIGVTLRIVRGGKNDSGKPSFKAKQERSSSPAASTATQTRALSAGMLATPDRWASARPSAAGLSDTTL